MGLLRAKSGIIDARFLLYAYLGPTFQETLRARTIHGSTVNRIPLIKMPGFPIEFPTDIWEQRAIAAVLGAIDDKIEQNRRTAQALERLARAIFRAWFVDFEPVKAKAAGAISFPSMPQPAFDALPTYLPRRFRDRPHTGWMEGQDDFNRVPCQSNSRTAEGGDCALPRYEKYADTRTRARVMDRALIRLWHALYERRHTRCPHYAVFGKRQDRFRGFPARWRNCLGFDRVHRATTQATSATDTRILLGTNG